MRLGKLTSIFTLAAAIPAFAGTISYTCAPKIGAVTCDYLNTTVAGGYDSTFTNANALIYIQYGTTFSTEPRGSLQAPPASTILLRTISTPPLSPLKPLPTGTRSRLPPWRL